MPQLDMRGQNLITYDQTKGSCLLKILIYKQDSSLMIVTTPSAVIARFAIPTIIQITYHTCVFIDERSHLLDINSHGFRVCRYSLQYYVKGQARLK